MHIYRNESVSPKDVLITGIDCINPNYFADIINVVNTVVVHLYIKRLNRLMTEILFSRNNHCFTFQYG